MTNDFMNWAFKAILVGLATIAVSQVTAMKESIVNLNTSIAILLTDSKHQGDLIRENRTEIKEIKEIIHASK